MGVTVKVTLDDAKIQNLFAAAKRTADITAEAVLTDVRQEQVTPRDLGTLEDTAAFVVGEDAGDQHTATVVFDTDYARRLYYHPEYDFRDDKNPNAQGKWMEPWISGDKKDFAVETFAAVYKKEAGL